MKLQYSYANGGIHPVIGQVLHPVLDAIGSEKERYMKFLCNPLSFIAYNVNDCMRIKEQKRFSLAVPGALGFVSPEQGTLFKPHPNQVRGSLVYCTWR
jgi:hypothetical protein